MLLKREFFFVRHGQTDANIGPLQKKDPGDISINATGLDQAHKIEPIIASLPVKTICYSPLKRAKETKEICCARLSAIQQEISNLTECPSAEIWQKMTALGPDARSCSEEPVYSFMQRVRQGINEALSKEGPVLIVAHGGIHWSMCCWMDVKHEWIIDNCIPVHFSISEKGHWVARILTNKTL